MPPYVFNVLDWSWVKVIARSNNCDSFLLVYCIWGLQMRKLISRSSSKLNTTHYNNIFVHILMKGHIFGQTWYSKSSQFLLLPALTIEPSPRLSPFARSQSSHTSLRWSELRNFSSPFLITSKRRWWNFRTNSSHFVPLYARVMSDEGSSNFRVVSDVFPFDWQCSYTPFVVFKEYKLPDH